MKSIKSENIVFRVTEEMKKKIRLYATKRKMSISEFVEFAVNSMMEAKK